MLRVSCLNPACLAASWFGFFSTFFSTFAPAPIAPVLKKSTTLGLTRSDLGAGNLASVSSNIICRFLMGIVCDKLGARRGLAFILLITAPAIFGIAFVNSAAGFIVCRFFIGMGLASFVACQVWCSQQFSKSIVGVANATSGGWGNLGGGITNLLMPYVFLGFMSATGNNENVAWRLCFIIPFVLHLLAAALAMSGRDLPDGNYAELEKQGSKQKSKADVVIKVGLSNINAWILTATYGFCFGVELTMTNVAALYFYEFHAVAQSSAGVMASTFGLVNLFARSLGGICSDWANAKWGMRGRIWALWFWQMVEGALCMVMGFLTLHLTPPDFTGPANIEGWTAIGGWVKPTASGWVPISQGVTSWVPFTANATNPPTFIPRCGAMQIELTDDMRASLDPRYDGLNTVVLSEPPSPFGNGDDCVSNSGLIVPVVIVVFAFSLAVQMAEGLTYGIVPSVSRPALGVVSGMVGAGGNAGSLITAALFFTSDEIRTDQGLVNMGITILAVTMLLVFVYFPDMGGMFFKAGSISYDPQIIKPPANYRGSDSLNYDEGTKSGDVQLKVEGSTTPAAA